MLRLFATVLLNEHKFLQRFCSRIYTIGGGVVISRGLLMLPDMQGGRGFCYSASYIRLLLSQKMLEKYSVGMLAIRYFEKILLDLQK